MFGAVPNLVRTRKKRDFWPFRRSSDSTSGPRHASSMHNSRAGTWNSDHFTSMSENRSLPRSPLRIQSPQLLRHLRDVRGAPILGSYAATPSRVPPTCPCTGDRKRFSRLTYWDLSCVEPDGPHKKAGTLGLHAGDPWEKKKNARKPHQK